MVMLIMSGRLRSASGFVDGKIAPTSAGATLRSHDMPKASRDIGQLATEAPLLAHGGTRSLLDARLLD